LDDGIAVETEAAVHAGVCDAADPALALSSAVPAAEIAFVVAVVGVGFDVERVPILMLASWRIGVWRPSSVSPFLPPALLNVMLKSPVCGSVKY